MEKMAFLHILVIWRILRKSRKKNRRQKISFSRGGFVLIPLKKRKSLLFRAKNCIFFLASQKDRKMPFTNEFLHGKFCLFFALLLCAYFAYEKKFSFPMGHVLVKNFTRNLVNSSDWQLLCSFWGFFSWWRCAIFFWRTPKNGIFGLFFFKGKFYLFQQFLLTEEKRGSWRRWEGEKLQESPFLFCLKVFKLWLRVSPHELSKKCQIDFPGVVFSRELWRNSWISGSLLFFFFMLWICERIFFNHWKILGIFIFWRNFHWTEY